MQKILLSIFVILFISGCTSGLMYSSSPTGKEIVYSPLFASESYKLTEGAEFKVSVVIVGGVDEMNNSIATAKVHFKNDSQQTHKISLKEFKVEQHSFRINVPEIVLKAGECFDTKQISIFVPSFSTYISLSMNYELNGEKYENNFEMRRVTMDEIKKRK